VPDPPGANAQPEPEDEALQYTHSGRRYLLGYGHDFFGIWDRQQPAAPARRWPRTDEGWRSAWVAFHADEPDATEVGLTAGTPVVASSPTPFGSATPARGSVSPPQRRISGAWWLLPIFMGWLGGLIAYLINKDVDPQRARAMLITGIALSLVLFLLILAGSTSSVSG